MRPRTRRPRRAANRQPLEPSRTRRECAALRVLTHPRVLIDFCPTPPGWRNWQTRKLEVLVSDYGRAGSNPVPGNRDSYRPVQTASLTAREGHICYFRATPALGLGMRAPRYRRSRVRFKRAQEKHVSKPLASARAISRRIKRCECQWIRHKRSQNALSPEGQASALNRGEGETSPRCNSQATADTGTRTQDLSFTKAVLYQLSYVGVR